MLCSAILHVLLAFQTGLNADTPVRAVDELIKGKNTLAAHDYAGAAEEFRAAVALSQGDEQGILLEALTQLGSVSRLQGRPDEAEQALTRAVPLAAKLHGDTSLEIASILSSLSGAQRALGKQKDSVLSLESAIQIREARPNERTSELANDLISAANIHLDLGSASEATGSGTQWRCAIRKVAPWKVSIE